MIIFGSFLPGLGWLAPPKLTRVWEPTLSWNQYCNVSPMVSGLTSAAHRRTTEQTPIAIDERACGVSHPSRKPAAYHLDHLQCSSCRQNFVPRQAASEWSNARKPSHLISKTQSGWVNARGLRTTAWAGTA